MRKNIIIIVAIILLAIGFRAISSWIAQKDESKSRAKSQTPSVTVVDITTKDVIREYEANARVLSKYRVEVLARVSGYLTKSYFKEGDYVKQGQILFEIEPQEYQYAAGQAKANLDNIQSQSSYYNKQLTRYKELVSKDYIAKSDYDNMLSQSNSYKAQVESAANIYRDAQRNLSYTKVKAPVNGRIGLIQVTQGNFVSMNSGALTTIHSTDPIYVTFPLNSKDYAELVRIDKNPNTQRRVEFTSSSGQKYKYDGIQDFRDNEIDESTGTITLRATFKNPDGELIQGDFGKIKIYSNLKDTLPIVPQSATQQNQEGKFVYVLDEQNIPNLTYIEVMGQTDGNWIVTKGLKQGDRVIATGLAKVIPGKPVRIVSQNPNAPKQPIKQKKTNFLNKLNIIKKLKGEKNTK